MNAYKESLVYNGRVLAEVGEQYKKGVITAIEYHQKMAELLQVRAEIIADAYDEGVLIWKE